MATHRALVGIDYPPNKRVEAGDTVTDLPGDAVKWLLADGYVEVVKANATPAEILPPAFTILTNASMKQPDDIPVPDVVTDAPVDPAADPAPVDVPADPAPVDPTPEAGA